MKTELSQVIDKFISGDWGTEEPTDSNTILVSCIRGADIVPITNGQFDNIPQRYISTKSIQKRLLSEGDLIVEKSGGSPSQSTGRIVYVSKALIEAKGNIVCSNFCIAIRVKDAWNPLYIYYYWQQFYNSGVFFNFEGKTSGIKNLQLDNALSAIKLDEVSMKEQNCIVGVLYSIEQKLWLNRSINANLEAMAKQLYDYWFVQFDFPDSNGKPYKSSGGKMLYNPKLKRDIPEGWEVKELSNLADVRKGDMITSKDATEGKVKVVAGGISFAYYNGKSNRPSNTITVSGSGANAGYINFWREPIFASDCTTVNFENEFDTIMCWYGIRLFQNVLFNYAVGAAQPHVYPNHVGSLPMVVIPDSIKKEVGDFFFSTNQQIRCNDEEIDRLTALRDSLLPMLMNGQVSVL